jgi:hypothetical protein
MREVYVNATAFDKNSNESFSKTIIAGTKNEFDRKVSEFEAAVPFTKWYMQLEADEVLDEEQLKIVEDHEVI